MINNSGNNDKDYFLIQYNLANVDFTPSDQDSDRDSVPDRLDSCPNTIQGEDVDENGCALSQKDSDNDGITDDVDVCANTSTGSSVDGNGCAQNQVDSDQDTIPDYLDRCPDTPPGVNVNSEGCEFVVLEPEFFEVKSLGESCVNTNNGSIGIESSDSRNYRAILNGSKSVVFTGAGMFTELAPGDYNLCISVEDLDSDELCYNLTIEALETLSIDTAVDLLSKTLKVELQGSDSYTIDFNGKRITTKNTSISLPLKTGKNALTVATEASCQGNATYEVEVPHTISVFPNPFVSGFEVYGTTRQVPTTLIIYDVGGKTVFRNTFSASEPIIVDNLEGFPNGIYVVEYNDGVKRTFKKVIKNE